MDTTSQTKLHDFADMMLEHMPVGVALFEAETLRLLTADTRFQAFLGPCWQEGKAIGQLLLDWIPETHIPSITAIFRSVAETDIPYRGEEYPFHKEQSITYWNWMLDPIHDNEGRITHLLLTISNVTGQVQARQQTEKVHASLSQTNRAVEIERKRLEVIEKVARSVRESMDIESIGKAAIDIIVANFLSLHACVSVHIADPLQQALRALYIYPTSDPDKQQALSALQHIPYNSSLLMAKACHQHEPIVIEDLYSPDASGSKSSLLAATGVRGYVCIPLWFKDHFEGTLTTTFGESIHVDGPEVQTLVGCSMHIAAALAHARLHAAIENEHARMRTVLDQLPEGILLVEAADECISYANAASVSILGVPLIRITGFPLSKLAQSRVIADMDSSPIPLEDLPVVRGLRGQTISGREMMVTRPDGSKVVLLCSAAPLLTEYDVITGAVVVFQDITERKSIEQEKNEFLSIASHELRTPITAIQGFAEILQMYLSRGDSLDSTRSLRAISGIIEYSQRLTRLIEEMLDISLIEKAQLLVNLVPCDLLAILTHVIESQSITAKNHQLRFVMEGIEANDRLIGCFDEDRVMQIFHNLLSNAIKYSPAGSEIEVGLRYTQDRPDEVLTWVKDRGIGIPAKEIPLIFRRFHRINTSNRFIKGLGIGLYLVQELVARHGGRIWVESTEGVGSTFYVTLPLKTYYK